MTALSDACAAWSRRRHLPAPVVAGADAWTVDLAIGGLRLRALRADDVARLLDFAVRLGERGKALFCPYPWDEPAKLPGAFAAAIAQHQRRIDAMYLIEDGAACIAHGFLWKAGGNPHSAAHGVEVPELGVAVAEAWQGRGLGSLLVRALQGAAIDLGRDAVELTTAMENDRGWETYLSAGFVLTGIIRTPLGVDVTAATLGQVAATRWRDERQLVWMARPDRRGRVERYLAIKRDEAQRL